MANQSTAVTSNQSIMRQICQDVEYNIENKLLRYLIIIWKKIKKIFFFLINLIFPIFFAFCILQLRSFVFNLTSKKKKSTLSKFFIFSVVFLQKMLNIISDNMCDQSGNCSISFFPHGQLHTAVLVQMEVDML